jgi:hypothetical protein
MMGVFNQKLDTYRQRYEQQMPGDTAYSPVLPQASSVLQKHNVSAYQAQPQAAATPLKGAPPPPPKTSGAYPAGFNVIGAH